ncbi:cytochrome c-type biogenesis protein CcmH [Psychrosphaera sp. 1_MG-2023]|uniref:Cytochrome c-type biogenesis protein n=1 Tax=Psychrosphaera algicola TaxID=3023714 RepID=A0ABT5FJU2_9GAMM|nr:MULTISPECIES: cytochrome c-type biogenesis protein [unclassified Psychrosphaera]MDC2891466.1 cytochrome c-type biogenesis protein CcmH [Psychrosphaera sp. G1-22]MDO6720577.1 cytochrome c-type biogenesis protein CcmH [Psychrosphaera sp. 1_MG-2023]
MMKSISILIVILASLVSVKSYGFDEMVTFDNPKQEAEYRELIKELRCPKCQNQNIADSNAIVAKDMRAKALLLLQEGKSKQQVVDYMINRYGQFAHYRPPVNIATIMLWAIPVGFILMCIILLWRRSRLSMQVDNATDTAGLNSELDNLLDEVSDLQNAETTRNNP